ncbi:DUF1194 domain-containing protein [Mesorhizobium sp. WSM2239]|uniref:DUF1194 domain-containing protein n=2 Tax=unclassified Mesorhizobium TaxID=325217 RepID=A0AAU8DDC2_9HYPH
MKAALPLLLWLACHWPVPAHADAVAVDVELVLAVDVSESMDPEEFAIQRAGYAAALRHPGFIRAVLSGPNSRIALSYFEWAGTVRRQSIVPWQVIDGADSARAFADSVESLPADVFRGTSISAALDFGASSIETNGFDGARRVIDVSGDGPNNFGGPVMQARDAALRRNIVVNGLPILIRPSPIFPAIDRYYAECVTGGPGSFVLPIRSISEFATAIRRKLILEVSGASPDPRVLPAQAGAPVDCLVGERERQRLSDRFYPELDR